VGVGEARGYGRSGSLRRIEVQRRETVLIEDVVIDLDRRMLDDGGDLEPFDGLPRAQRLAMRGSITLVSSVV